MKKVLGLLMLTAFFNVCFSQAGNLDLSFGNKGIVRTDFESSEVLYDNQCQQILLSPDASFYLVIEMNRQTLITHRLANGAIDPTYGEQGYSVPVYMREPKAVMQPNGKILVGGTAQTPNKKDFTFARFNTDGTLDSSFSADGLVTIDFSNTDDSFFGLALQADGKIVAVGSTYDNVRDRIAMARFNPDGSPDNSFSGDGKQVTNLIGDAGATAVALQKDGKIVIAGYFNKAGVISMAVGRYTTDGSIDSSFAGDGFHFITLGWYSVAKTIVIQNDGKIIAGGFTLNELNIMKFLLARLNTDGSLDPGFSGDGIQISNVSDNDALINAMALQNDGKIVVAGAALSAEPTDFIVARYNADGSLDNSFSGDGIAIPGVNAIPYLASASANSLVIQPGGKIMIAGSYRNSRAFAVATFNIDGTLDNNFGEAGIMRDFKRSGRTFFVASAVQQDGKIITAGVTETSPENLHFVVTRYNIDGSYDKSFSEDGILIANFGPLGAEARALAIQPDGKIVVAGEFWNGSDGKFDFALIRLNTDGSPDNSFSGDGQVLTRIQDNSIATDMVIQPDGKIILGGVTASPGGGTDFALVRYNSDGTIDNTFSGDGILTGDSGSNDDQVVDLLLRPDGKLIVVVNGQTGKLAFFRYNADGSPDLTFDGDGMMIIENRGFMYTPYAALLQPDGAMVVAGTNFTVERFNSNGSLDNSFSEDGKMIIDFNQYGAQATSIAIQPDGKIIIGGYVKEWTRSDMAVARVTANGSLDNSFSGDGKQVVELEYGQDMIQSLSIHGDRLYAAGSTTYGGQLGMLAAFRLGCELSVSIPGATSLKRGVDSNTVYPAYQPASGITLVGHASGGNEPYTYLWSNGAVTPSVTVSPTMPTTYSVTVTDASGCSHTMSKFINVVNVRCGNKMDKISVCQVPPGKATNTHSICVSANAVAAHLDNGSRLGNCIHEASITKRMDMDEQPPESLDIFPNPTHTSFTLNYRSVDRSAVEFIIWDASGRMVEKRNFSPGQSVEFGAAYRPGIYYVQLTQGDQKRWKKLVKYAY